MVGLQTQRSRMFSSLIFWLTRLLFNKQGQVGMIYFHGVPAYSNPFHSDDLNEKDFLSLIRHLKKHFQLISTEQWYCGSYDLNKPALLISFDDGYKDNIKAAQILKEEGGRGTFFVSTDWPRHRGSPSALWHVDIMSYFFEDIRRSQHDVQKTKQIVDHVQAILQREKRQRSPMKSSEINPGAGYQMFHHELFYGMNDDDLRSIYKDGHSVGGHTATHRILSTLDDKSAYIEIASCYDYLKTLLPEQKHLFFAYPNGTPLIDFTDKHRSIVKEVGFNAAFSTEDAGFHADRTKEINLFSLPRFLPYRKHPLLRTLACEKISGEKVQCVF